MESMEVTKETEENTPLLVQNRDQKATRKRRNISLKCIIIIVVLERTAYYSLLGNLLLFLNNYIGLHDAESASIILVFIGLLWIMCVLGGYIADRFGKFRILWMSFLLYIFAYCFMPLLAVLTDPNLKIIDKEKLHTRWICLPALACIAFSEAVYKANIAPFGADQLQHRSEKITRKFFNWYYWCMNLGSLIAYSVLAYVQQNVKYGFVIGYGVPLFLLVLSFIALIAGRKSYKNVPSSRAVFSTVWTVTKEAFSKRKVTVERQVTSSYEHFRPITHWLDRAMAKYGGTHLECDVEEVKLLYKIIPIFILLIPYWALYWQMMSTFIMQGIHMKIPNIFANTETKFPAASLNLFEIIVVLLFIPLMDRIIYPFLERRGCHMPVVARMSLGMLFASSAMVIAGFVEVQRQHALNASYVCNQTINKQLYNFPCEFSIFYQIPQYCIFGISEVFASVAGLEFAYRQAPETMKGFVMGLFYASSGLGSLLGSGFFGIAISLRWVKQGKRMDLKGFLQYYFFMLAGIMFVSWLLFLWFAKRYRIGYTSGTQSLYISTGRNTDSNTQRSPQRQSSKTRN